MKSATNLWHRLQTYLHGQAGASREQALHAEAREEMRVLHEASRRHLADMESLLAEMQDHGSPAQLRQAEQAYKQLRHSFERTKIALMDTRTLQHEWEDWCRMHEFPTYHVTPEHEAREEMIRSELVVRGVRLGLPRRITEEAAPVPTAVEPVMTAPWLPVSREREVEVDDLDEWQVCFENGCVDVGVLQHEPDTMEEMQTSAQAAQMLKIQSGHRRLERRLRKAF